MNALCKLSRGAVVAAVMLCGSVEAVGPAAMAVGWTFVKIVNDAKKVIENNKEDLTKINIMSEGRIIAEDAAKFCVASYIVRKAVNVAGKATGCSGESCLSRTSELIPTKMAREVFIEVVQEIGSDSKRIYFDCAIGGLSFILFDKCLGFVTAKKDADLKADEAVAR